MTAALLLWVATLPPCWTDGARWRSVDVGDCCYQTVVQNGALGRSPNVRLDDAPDGNTSFWRATPGICRGPLVL